MHPDYLKAIEGRCLESVINADGEDQRMLSKLIKKQLPNVKIGPILPHSLHVLMVDDALEEIGVLLPHLLSLTRFRAKALLYKGEGSQNLVHSIEKEPHDVTLMDYDLHPPHGERLHGTRIISALRERHSKSTIIGCSGRENVREEFLQNGAKAFLHKVQNPTKIVTDLAKLLDPSTY